jgi:hypothetical protein
MRDGVAAYGQCLMRLVVVEDYPVSVAGMLEAPTEQAGHLRLVAADDCPRIQVQPQPLAVRGTTLGPAGGHEASSAAKSFGVRVTSQSLSDNTAVWPGAKVTGGSVDVVAGLLLSASLAIVIETSTVPSFRIAGRYITFAAASWISACCPDATFTRKALMTVVPRFIDEVIAICSLGSASPRGDVTINALNAATI